MDVNGADLKKQAMRYNDAHHEALLKICEPLKQLDITSFFYRRYYTSGSFSLSTHQQWLSSAIENDVYNSFQNVIDETIKRKFLFSTVTITERNAFLNALILNGKPSVEKNIASRYFYLLKDFNIHQIVSTLNYCGDYIENISFVTDRSDVDLATFFINNPDLIARFIMYFKDKAKKILKTKEKEALSPSTLIIGNKPIIEDKKKQNFINATKFKRVSINCSTKELVLSNKEASILHHLSRGKTAKEIARELSISSRTIEYHIDNMKSKTGLHSKSGLVDLFHDNFRMF